MTIYPATSTLGIPNKGDVCVRESSPSDREWLTEKAKDLGKFYGTKRPILSENEDVLTDLITVMLQRPHAIFIAEKQGVGPIGFICGMFSRNKLNPATSTFFEVGWWVVEKFRYTRAKSMLLDAFTAHGKAVADWVSFSVPSHSPVHRSFLRRGYQLQERRYLMEA